MVSFAEVLPFPKFKANWEERDFFIYKIMFRVNQDPLLKKCIVFLPWLSGIPGISGFVS